MIDLMLLERLCTCQGISGDEKSVAQIIKDEIKDYAESVTTDALGNIIVFKKGKNRAVKKLMISAHMDEVGLMVINITSEGFLKFDEVGGLDKRILIGKQVTVGPNKIKGVIGIKPIHLCKGDEAASIPSLGEMYIDIGANSITEALQYISIGDSINFISDFESNGKYIKAKALDDRFGCYVLINMIKNDLEYDTYFVFAVQEEVGLRGAQTAAYTVNPEFAIVVETTTAADLPEVDKTRRVCSLGSGAVISVMDRRTVYDKILVNAAFSVADETGVKAQYKCAVAGGNDAGVIHKSRGGVRTLAVSLPCRYLHAPSTVANIEDCESIIKIVSALALKISGGKINEREGVK